MDEELKDLKDRLEKAEEALTSKASAAVVEQVYLRPINERLAALEFKIDRLLDETIKAITTNSVEGLKTLRR
jgi:hypothetical protein